MARISKPVRDNGRYRSLFEECPVPVLVVQSSGTVAAANNGMSDLLGYECQELVGMHARDICAEPADWDKFQGALEKEGYLRAHEMRLCDREGVGIDCLVTASIVQGGHAATKEYECAVWDFREYKRTLENLQESERLYRLLSENVTDGLWTSYWDSDWNMHITYLSDSIKNVIGFSSEETQPKSLWEMMTPASAERGTRAYLEQLALEEKGEGADPCRSWTTELEMYYKNGGTVWAEARTTFLRDDSGRPVGIMGVTRDITQRKRTEDTLRALSSRLVEVQEEERRRIARELHDQIGQALTGLKLSLEVIATQPVHGVAPRVSEALASINDIMDRVRDLSLELRPPMLDDLGLMPTLMRHFERYKGQTGIRVDFKQKGLQRRFPPELETAVFRIVQESLTNVARHADVDRVSVRVVVSPGVLDVQIEDKGKGFDPRSTLISGKSSGLAGMRERAALLGGQLEVHSTLSRGTRLEAKFPLAPLQEEKDNSWAL